MQMGIFGLGTGMVSLGPGLVPGVTQCDTHPSCICQSKSLWDPNLFLTPLSEEFHPTAQHLAHKPGFFDVLAYKKVQCLSYDQEFGLNLKPYATDLPAP